MDKLLPCKLCNEQPYLWLDPAGGYKISCINECILIPPKSQPGWKKRDDAIQSWNKEMEHVCRQKSPG